MASGPRAIAPLGARALAAERGRTCQQPPRSGARATYNCGGLLEDGSYKITEAKSGKALTAVKAGHDGEAKITVEPWRDQSEQKW